MIFEDSEMTGGRRYAQDERDLIYTYTIFARESWDMPVFVRPAWARDYDQFRQHAPFIAPRPKRWTQRPAIPLRTSMSRQQVRQRKRRAALQKVRLPTPTRPGP